MTRLIDRIKKTRQYLLEQIKELDALSLNEIPAGFNNNIAWNLGHLIAAQQGICYVRTGVRMTVEDRYFLEYKPGTRPERFLDEREIKEIKQLLISSLDQFPGDYRGGLFANYPAWTTRYGVEITSIDDAIQFVLFHEGLHSGVIQSMKRLVHQQLIPA
jgi:hypothetical protein